MASNYIQNWDKKGNIYYTNNKGEVVDFKVNPFTQLARQAQATLANVGDWFGETNPNSDAYKQKVALTTGVLSMPFGIGATATNAIAKGLVPVVGKKIAQTMAQGASGGLAGGAVEGMVDAGLNKENVALGGLKGGAFGLLAGLGGGYGLGKITQGLAKKGLYNNALAQEQYFDDYIDGLANQTNAMAEYRGLKQGYKPKNGQILNDSSNPKHRLQADLINKYNPKPENSSMTWIENADDIYNFEDTLKDSDWADYWEQGLNPDYSGEMIKDALKNGEIEVYSSHPIEKGIFVSPSKMEAESYSGTGEVFSKKIPLTDVAWIDPTQGQYAPIDKEYMERVFNDAKNGIKTLSKQDYRNLGKKYYSEEFMPEGIYKDGYGQIDFINDNRGKDEIQVLQHYPILKNGIKNSKQGISTNKKNETDRIYDHFLFDDQEQGLDYLIENRNDGRKTYKMTQRKGTSIIPYKEYKIIPYKQ